ncbi:hypothetical protein Poli38472_009765 [Pythium oligandrum]|uniref:Uncharacterized protein n=1 Tax=Pythium oligandrum TaxID=41045 RepID=A0A8K1CFB2_PYTOL|nr:hypothetical protein Poli38472_009765 [Pythium oligandrum]|eukprot:TMW62272.1 hypothetical protein Poli38472_009765 [Pythium oligandrum]
MTLSSSTTTATTTMASGVARSPFRTPQRASSGHSPTYYAKTSTNNNQTTTYTRRRPSHDDGAAYGPSVLDQLHAEQKSTIEALTYQIEFYRQREERYKKEMETLRKYVDDVSDKHGSREEAASVTRLAMENRVLGEEVDTLRNKLSVWTDEKARHQRQQQELEQQLHDAKLSLASFTQAVEQLELKMQRKDAEVQTTVLELEQDVRVKTQESTQARHECDVLRQQLQHLQTLNDENQRLRSEVQSVLQTTTTQSSEVEELRKSLREVEAVKTQRETALLEIQTRLGETTAEATTLRLEVEQKQRAIEELQSQLQSSSKLLALREKLITSDSTLKQESEAQRLELRTRINQLENERNTLRGDISALETQCRELKAERDAIKSRLSTKDHAVVVSTLRSEMSALKERLRAQSQHEKAALQSEKESLLKEIDQLTTRLAEKERLIRRLQDEMLSKETTEKRYAHETTMLRSTVERLERDLAHARLQYQELIDARGSLAEQLDYGFKELLEDEQTASAAFRQVEALQHELETVKRELALREKQLASANDELEHISTRGDRSASELRCKIDALHEQLNEKDQELRLARQAEMELSLVEQEKNQWDTQMKKLRSLFQADVEAERERGEEVRRQLERVQIDKAEVQARVTALQREIVDRDDQVLRMQTTVEGKDLELAAMKREHKRLGKEMEKLQEELKSATQVIEDSRQAQSKRERRLMRERQQLEEHLTQLVARIEAASKRNEELGNKVVSLVKKTKSDGTEIVALSTQVKAEKQKVAQLERAMASVRGRDVGSSDELQRRLRDVTAVKESYQNELAQLQKALDHALNEKDVMQRQRADAMKRVKTLMTCQEQMKSTVESHTAELVEEIEVMQNQLDNERKRCTVLLGNEKTLLRDITEKNATITRLQQNIAALQQQLHKPSSSSSSVGNAYESKKRSSNPPRYVSNDTSLSSVQSNGSKATSAKELDRILGNLERISEFSTRSSSPLAP